MRGMQNIKKEVKGGVSPNENEQELAFCVRQVHSKKFLRVKRFSISEHSEMNMVSSSI